MSTLTIAFITPLAHGHGNVHYAVLRNLMTEARAGTHLHIHVIGDEPQRKRLQTLPASEHAAIHFHPMAEQDYHQAFTSAGGGALVRGPPLSLSRGGLRTLDPMPEVMLPTAAEYLARYEKIVGVLERVKPDLFVVDIIFNALCMDAVRKTGVPFVVLAPGFSIDTAGPAQPGGRGFWKYPWLFTNFTYPVPLYLAPVNMLLAIYFIIFVITTSKRKEVDAARKAAGISGSVLGTPGTGGRANIHASLAELEYPHVPLPNTVFAGPIITPVPPLSGDGDTALSRFLNAGRTVLVNLGSLFSYTEDDVAAVAKAIVVAQVRMEDRGRFQVIWKLPQMAEFQSVLDKFFAADREGIYVTEWIDPPMLAVLQHENLAVAVHHGGANSFIEATYVGVPQVILPVWFDLYGYAVRAEWLGIGIYANRGAEPTIDAPQLADALVRVLRDKEAEEGGRIRAKAGEVGRMCRRGRGDRRAADAILRAARGEDVLESSVLE